MKVIQGRYRREKGKYLQVNSETIFNVAYDVISPVKYEATQWQTSGSRENDPFSPGDFTVFIPYGIT